MKMHLAALADESRLRVVFASKAIAMELPVGSTLGDIAEWVGDAARKHNGSLRSIDVKMVHALAGAH